MTTMTRRELMYMGAAASAGAIGLHPASAQAPTGRAATIEARPQAVSIDTATGFFDTFLTEIMAGIDGS